MARSRKTFDVERLKQIVNNRNQNSTCDPCVRNGWNSILESVLMEANNYRGFGYISDLGKLPKGQKPGIIWEDGKPSFPDPSRRFYF